MITEPVVGKRYYFRGKRYRVVATEMLDCANCDAHGEGALCLNVVCQGCVRSDSTNIILKLQRKYMEGVKR